MCTPVAVMLAVAQHGILGHAGRGSYKPRARPRMHAMLKCTGAPCTALIKAVVHAVFGSIAPRACEHACTNMA